MFTWLIFSEDQVEKLSDTNEINILLLADDNHKSIIHIDDNSRQ